MNDPEKERVRDRSGRGQGGVGDRTSRRPALEPDFLAVLLREKLLGFPELIPCRNAAFTFKRIQSVVEISLWNIKRQISVDVHGCIRIVLIGVMRWMGLCKRPTNQSFLSVPSGFEEWSTQNVRPPVAINRFRFRGINTLKNSMAGFTIIIMNEEATEERMTRARTHHIRVRVNLLLFRALRVVNNGRRSVKCEGQTTKVLPPHPPGLEIVAPFRVKS